MYRIVSYCYSIVHNFCRTPLKNTLVKWVSWINYSIIKSVVTCTNCSITTHQTLSSNVQFSRTQPSQELALTGNLKTLTVGPRWRILTFQELVKKKTLHFLEVNKHREYVTRIVFEGVLCIRPFLALTCLSRLKTLTEKAI